MTIDYSGKRMSKTHDDLMTHDDWMVKDVHKKGHNSW